MLVVILGIALSYLIWVLSSNFAVFVLARIIGGISKGHYRIFHFCYLPSVVDPELDPDPSLYRNVNWDQRYLD